MENLIQLQRAHALAYAHYHLWAQSIEDISTISSIEEIQAIALEHHTEGLPGGIISPSFDEDGYIIHTTATGRLSWLVFPNGETVLRVSRPHNGESAEVCGARITPSGVLDIWGLPWDAPEGVFCLPRHWATLLEAIEALLPLLENVTEEEDSVPLSVVREKAQPDETLSSLEERRSRLKEELEEVERGIYYRSFLLNQSK